MLQCFSALLPLFPPLLPTPPPACRSPPSPSPLARTRPYSSRLAASQVGAGIPEAARLRLHKPELAPSSSLSLFAIMPPWELDASIHPSRSTTIQFTSPLSSPHRHAPPKLPSTAPRCLSRSCVVFFFSDDRDAAVSSPTWLGHHGSSRRHLSHVLCSSCHLDAHRPFGFHSEGLDAPERAVTPVCSSVIVFAVDGPTPTPLRGNQTPFRSLGELLSALMPLG
jgi:hypothetical protein